MDTIDFFENGLLFWCNLARNELADLHRFHLLSEQAWEKRDSKVQHQVSEIIEANPEHDPQEVVESHAWELHLNQMKFPRVHREATLVAIQNFLESNLSEMCETVSDAVDSGVKPHHMKGRGIDRSLLYLSKVAGFDWSAFAHELTYMKNARSLRNQIVHNGGRLPSNTKSRLSRFVAANPHLRGLAGSPVILDSGFIPEWIGILDSFFDKLDAEVQAFIGRVNRA